MDRIVTGRINNGYGDVGLAALSQCSGQYRETVTGLKIKWERMFLCSFFAAENGLIFCVSLAAKNGIEQNRQ